MKSFGLKASTLACLLILTLSSLVAAQAPASPVDWETLRPDGEDFSVQMPKGSTAEAAKEPYHKFELNTTTHLAQLPNGSVFAVMTLSGIKSNPALYSELERTNSYVDAFKNFFPGKIRKGAVAKLTLVRDKVLQGNQGREYRVTIAELSGTAHVYATRKRFYAVVFLNNKKDEETQEEFLSSFLIPERYTPAAVIAPQPAQPAPAATQSSETPDAPAKPSASGDVSASAANASNTGEANDTPRTKKHGPISGGVLNGKAIVLPAPEYPASAKAAGVSGTVVVRVLIDEQGNVITAQAISGPPALQQPSINAAQMAKFSPTLLMGEPVQVTGVITYNFVRE